MEYYKRIIDIVDKIAKERHLIPFLFKWLKLLLSLINVNYNVQNKINNTIALL